MSQEDVFLGRDISCYEQTIEFQGTRRDKQTITQKREFGIFITDFIFSDGYTYDFHFRHQGDRRKSMNSESFLPFYASVLGLISQLLDKNYTLGMEKPYIFENLCRLALAMPQQLMIHGVTRPTLRGVPLCMK